MIAIGITNSLGVMLLRHIRYFLAVAEQGNFTRAAEVLHVSQPTLSQQIKQLEETLGTPLLDRSGRTVRLTDAGAAWMRYARLALQDLDEGARAIHDVATLERGNLRLAMTPTFSAYLVGPVIDAFYRRYPGISLSIQEITQDKIEALLAEDRLDLGIAFGQAQSPDIEAKDLFSESLNMVVGADHLLAQRQHPLAAEELERQPLALLSEDFATRQFIDDYCRQQSISPWVAVEANAIGAILEIMRRGQLATILPAAIAQADTQLRSVKLVAALPARRAVLLQRKSAYRSAASQAFVAVLHQQDLMSAHSNPV